MTIYQFIAKRGPGDPPGTTEVGVQFDSEHDATLYPVVGAFVQFLQGVSFTRGSIAKFIDHELV